VTVFTIWAFIKSFFMAQIIPLGHVDGAFQTASALIRFDNNSVAGKDFSLIWESGHSSCTGQFLSFLEVQ
jgi:hypothetical protein